MSVQSKLAAFDYVVFRVTEWYTDKIGDWRNGNDLSKLKITKLLFFISAVTTSSDEPGLLETFDSFAALPYGHVESQIQDNMDNSLNFSITRDHLSFKPGVDLYKQGLEDEQVINLIDQAIAELKVKNADLITYNPFALVDLSHKWQSWKTVFALAKKNGKFSMPIPREMIMNEPKYFK